jgi:hypothetical protein
MINASHLGSITMALMTLPPQRCAHTVETVIEIAAFHKRGERTSLDDAIYFTSIKRSATTPGA